MAEIIKCKWCEEYINLEIEVHRDNQGNFICNKCNGIIDLSDIN